jgi:hypothetical protein
VLSGMIGVPKAGALILDSDQFRFRRYGFYHIKGEFHQIECLLKCFLKAQVLQRFCLELSLMDMKVAKFQASRHTRIIASS